MKASLLAVAVLATIAISSAVDEECVQRKVRGLAVHWPNPTDCSSFYRCTNKNVKRELLCPAGKEYNPKTGRCANLGKNLCKLSLKAPLAGPTNPCADAVSGSFVAAPGSCRGFNICSNNMAYPQTCDAGSYFNTAAAVCEPDTETSCWENLCLTKSNGAYLANDNDCHSFYICADQKAIAQECPTGSYFDTVALNCQPGECPSEVTTTEACTDEVTTPSTVTCTDEVTTITTEACTDEVTTPTTVTCTDEVTTPTTEVCTDEVTTPTTEVCTDEVTTPTTLCTDEVTTPTTVCTDKVTTPTTVCTDEITTPTTVCTDEVTTPTTVCTDEVTTPTTVCTDEVTTPTTVCTDEVTTPTTVCTDEVTTPTTVCTDEVTTPTTVCTDEVTTPTTVCTDEVTTPTTVCTDEVTTPTTVCTDEMTTPTTEICTDEITTPTTVCTDEITTPTTEVCTDEVTTPSTTDCTEVTTVVSTEACTDEPTCVSDPNCDCTQCLNAADNTVYPALSTNSGFCRCMNKKPNYYECPDGGIFEQPINVCVAQDKICPSSKCVNQPDYTLFPAANTTAGYCKCVNNEASYENCADAYNFDATLGICVNSSTDDCEEEHSSPAPVLCEGGYAEGDFIPNSDNCMLFSICFDGQLIESSCEYGNYYDAKSEACLPDTNGVCPQCTSAQAANKRNKRSIKAATCSEGDITCHPTDCDKFYVCDCYGNQILQECGVNNYFNGAAQECQPDTNNVCWPNTNDNCTCQEGQFSPVQGECYKYYICVGGQEILRECIEGSYFNPNTLRCQVDVNNVCWPKPSCTCPGGYEDGEMSPHPTDCDKYYICSDGEQVLHECGQDNYFNPDTQCCQPDVNNECWSKTECTCPGGYQEGQFSPHPNPEYCNKYYICTDGQQVLQECGVNNYFNNKTLQCELDTNNVCVIATNCTCPGGYEEGQFSPHPNPLLCGSFYVCTGGKQILQECGLNQFFNKTSQECEVDKTHVCWPNQCAGQVNGSLVANPQLCSAYFLCQNQEPIAEICAEGQWFDPSKSSCQPDVDAVCYNPCANDQTINLLPHPDCTKYYFCNGPQTIVGTCQRGGFDAVLGVCNPNKVCPGNECIGKYDGYAFPNPDNNTQFYICLNGVAMPQDCPPNHAFNPDVANGVCLPVADPDCDPTPCLSPDFNEAYQTLNKSLDEFCYCKNGLPLKIQCQDDMIFNNAIGACISNAPCDPTICPNSGDYTPSPNRNDTQSFCLCVSKVPVIVQCPNNGSFNPFTLLCSNVEISTQCNQFECMNQEDNYKFDALSPTDNGFCVCKEQIATFIPCAEDSTYNPAIGICIQADINCNSKQCVGLANNTKIPAITTTQGYCECVADKATFVNCAGNGVFNVTAQNCSLPVCDIDKCAALNEYQSFPASNTTAGFCLCINDNVVYKDCPYDQEFNIAVGVCTAKLVNCNDAMCSGIADGTSVPALYTQNGFCYCSGGEATFEQCPPNYAFNAEKQICLIDTEALCGDSTYCNSCFPTLSCSSYAATNSVTGFCVCNAAGPKFVPCEPGYEFNGQVCQQTAQSNCDISECATATLDNPITSPAINGNTSFCYCTGSDDVMLLNCPAGKYYNDILKLCTNVIEESCSCPNGIQNGEIVADTTTCNKYFECLDGVMHEQVCPAGQYFNDITKRCCVDTEGICSNQSECTCLGAYREGERIEHPVNGQMYYVCQNAKLHERNCGVGRIFNKSMNQCIKAPRLNNRHPQKRSVDHDVNEFPCIENDKRSVPSNCSQYEICLNQNWKRRTCTNYRYYNPEQQKCLEPKDDLVCMYAKLTTLPTCDAKMEQKVHKAKNCQQYYRCQKEKWRLKSCAQQQYFNQKLNTCVSVPLDNGKFQCETLGNKTQVEVLKNVTTCHHLSARYYEKNCAMYLMCWDNKWWYHYCPNGMYFNRSLNYCTPDIEQECPQVIKAKELAITEEFTNEGCLQDGLLRPSALACNRYFICIKGKWQMQHCSQEEFYDVSNAKCSPDIEGICSQLKMDCLTDDKRISKKNCSNYEQCSSDGKWIQKECPLGLAYDDIFKKCVTNDNLCSSLGFKRVCYPLESIAVQQNCSQFYYCAQDSWNVGMCLKGFMYSQEKKTCLPHSLEDKCKPLNLDNSTHPEVYSDDLTNNLCLQQLDGVSVAHPSDCTRYYICIQEKTSQEMQCSKGSYFETSLGYCRPNDGTCRLPLTGACANATDESMVAHPSDCQSYYKCSTINGTELMRCPEGEYFHKYIRQCRIDHGECKKDMATKCFGMEHGTRLPHELYCNIYYACVKGLAIPVECPDNHQFNPILGKCVHDEEKHCQDGLLIDSNHTYSCGNIADGSYLPDRKDCTRYYICNQGQAIPKKCSSSSYFDSELLLCVPDDGSCPFVDDDEGHNNEVPPDPIVCEGKHGYLMPDPLNCNNFYSCVNSKLKHERCYDQQFFNKTSSQCQLKSTVADQIERVVELAPIAEKQCLDKPTTIEKLCSELTEGSSLAEQGDCRRFITCPQEEGEEPLSQRCRNGESYDSLLGFCRQNDGTCLMENGQRVGECSGKHGQLTRDVNDCRGYFVCINGQKIAQSCQEDEYFSKSQNMCFKDTLKACSPAQQPEEPAKQSCNGLSESILYPYVNDNCRSYFQCVNNVPQIHKCADDLYFDPITIKCVKEKTECIMPAQNLQRSPELVLTFDKLCSEKEYNYPYVNFENNCRSFYICHSNGVVNHELCPLGMMFNKEFNVCMPEDLVKCQ